MRSMIAFLTTLTALGLSCIDPASPLKDEPQWVKQLIRDYEAAPVGNPPQSIWKYEYLGSTVYYVPAQCCDQFSDLYDAWGKIICHPDGGFAGTGDGRCPDFRGKRQKEELVWRDSRER
jgi:hypothetical protein